MLRKEAKVERSNEGRLEETQETKGGSRSLWLREGGERRTGKEGGRKKDVAGRIRNETREDHIRGRESERKKKSNERTSKPKPRRTTRPK